MFLRAFLDCKERRGWEVEDGGGGERGEEIEGGGGGGRSEQE